MRTRRKNRFKYSIVQIVEQNLKMNLIYFNKHHQQIIIIVIGIKGPDNREETAYIILILNCLVVILKRVLEEIQMKEHILA